jgi:O-methyltransferase involved in polyketide biosynthesis
MDLKPTDDRNYSTISPSAKALLLMKGLTNIPYARRAAELVALPERYTSDYGDKDMLFWGRVTHMEARYQSIDQLLEGLQINNFLELSSGFSFRGLDMVNKRPVHYIDTDLPGIIEQKKDMAATLQGDATPQGVLEILPLNALDEAQFRATVARFPEGPIAVVNEGLLMYLGMDEKKKLFALIHETLKQRGGYWVTADVYIRNTQLQRVMKFDDELEHFFEEHNIEANKFANFEEAEALFKEAGFVIDKEAEPDYAKMTSLSQFMERVNPEQMEAMTKIGRIQGTWRLRVAE